jgi:MerR family transcriptional regulator, thiopeptide resistance regulator
VVQVVWEGTVAHAVLVERLLAIDEVGRLLGPHRHAAARLARVPMKTVTRWLWQARDEPPPRVWPAREGWWLKAPCLGRDDVGPDEHLGGSRMRGPLALSAASTPTVIGVAGETGRAMKGTAMAWSIADVARISGVTSRTLRHYDEIGLLVPAYIGTNGHRHYEEAELLRLQQILLMRELGLGLREIAAVLERQVDQVAALREHHQRLLAERERLDVLAATVARTIAELEEDKDTDMAKISRPENLFQGFDTARHEAAAREQWPEEVEQSRQFAGTLTDEDQARLQQEATAAMVRMAEAMAAGAPVTDPAVQAEVDAHYRGICRMWTPNATAFTALGQTYVDDAQWRAAYDQVAIGLAAYQRDAMAAYADARLS